MAGINVFNVAFGINETELTRALERGEWNRAESIILDNSDSSFLDEGCYQRTPFFIALSGISEDGRPATRNLHIAKLLLEHGADVNFRVPATYFGSEYMSPGKTPLELIVEFYNLITLHKCHPCPQDAVRGWDPTKQSVISLGGHIVTSADELFSQIEDLVFVMMSNGGDVNINDEYRMSLLHRTVVFSDNILITKVLCENGADLNHCDYHGNTPLGAMCEAFPQGVSKFISSVPIGNPYKDCSHIEEKKHFLDYLLSLKGVQVNHQNKYGRTALFNCMVRGDLQSCLTLLKAPCDATLRGRVKEYNFSNTLTREISPLFAGLCSNILIRDHQEKETIAPSSSYSFLYHLVDPGYFNVPEIYRELVEYIDTDFPQFDHLKTFQNQLINLVFGGTSSNLRQMSARAIFQEVLLTPGKSNHCLFDHPSVNASFTMEDFNHPSDYNNIYLKHILTKAVLEKLIVELNLPRDSLIFFEVELFRQKLFSKFRQFRWFKSGLEFEFENVETESDDSESSENDSELEYW